MINMHFLPDVPVGQGKITDDLGLTTFAEQIYNAIKNVQFPPFTFGILGDWGTGKTSTLHLLHTKLSAGGEEYVTIWFDAWRYENESNAIYPMLNAIHKEYQRRIPSAVQSSSGFATKLQDVLSTSLFVLGNVGIRHLSKALTGESIDLEGIDEWLEKVREKKEKVAKVLNGWSDEVDLLRTQFGELLTVFAEDVAKSNKIDAKKVKFVLLIDDLDRCLPETTIRLLESLKNYLDVSNVIFVLALNAGIVYQGIRHKYGGVNVNGREYLEKILNYTFYVPEPEPKSLNEFAINRMKEILGEGQVNLYQAYTRAFSQVLMESHFSNPRKIKRILNRYIPFLSTYVNPVKNGTDIGNIIRLIVLAEYFPEVFQILLEYVQQVGEFNAKRRSFELEEFKQEYLGRTGNHLFSQFPQLSLMENLFSLRIPAQTETKLGTQAKQVHAITRLI